MPANRGIGRKHKSGTGGSKSQPAARELSRTRLPGATPAPRRAKPAKPPAAVAFERLPTGCQGDAVRAAVERLDAAVDSLEQAEQQYNAFHPEEEHGDYGALEKKLQAKPGQRSARWTREWLAQLDQMENEEELLLIELERRDALVSAAQLQLDTAMSGWEGAKGASVPPVPQFEPSADELEQGLAL